MVSTYSSSTQAFLRVPTRLFNSSSLPGLIVNRLLLDVVFFFF